MSDGIVTSDFPYLTRAEQLRFKQARDRGLVSFFKVASCAECGQDIPKTNHKQYCSIACYKRAGGEDVVQEENDGEW